jgi:hypothetical protein
MSRLARARKQLEERLAPRGSLKEV